MKRSLVTQLEMLKGQLNGYVGFLNYKYANLCIKAEPMALIPVTVDIEGEERKIEEVCEVAARGEFTFVVVPNFEEDLPAIAKAVAFFHPEFKQDIERMRVEVPEEGPMDAQLLLLTMPVVDDERYDVLKESVKLFYDDCKAKMEVAKANSEARVSALLAGESEETGNALKKEIDKLIKTMDGQRESAYNDKLKEIEEAHQKWQQDKQEAEAAEAAKSRKNILSMQMDGNEGGGE